MAAANFDNVESKNKGLSQKQLICTNKPLLHEIESLYSHDTVIDLLSAYLVKFQDLLSLKDESKLNDYQISICAQNILPFLRGLTIPEITNMFRRFLSGEYGHFYGNIDIMTLGEWVRQFKIKRGEMILSDQNIKSFIMKRDQNYELNI